MVGTSGILVYGIRNGFGLRYDVTTGSSFDFGFTTYNPTNETEKNGLRENTILQTVF
jgi:hypothetical protein